MHGKYSQENGKYSPIMTIADFQSKFKCISEQVYATVWQDLKSNNNKDRQRVVRSTQQQAHYANATMQSEKAKRTMIWWKRRWGLQERSSKIKSCIASQSATVLHGVTEDASFGSGTLEEAWFWPHSVFCSPKSRTSLITCRTSKNPDHGFNSCT